VPHGSRDARLATRRRGTVRPAVRRSRLPRAGPAFELLPSKLRIPSLRPGLVERTELVSRLQGTTARVVSVAAPAGYGKTIVLAQWAARERRAVAWVDLDHRDNDPIVFLTYVAAALDSVSPLDPDVFAALAASSSSIWSAALPRVCAALASVPKPVVLVLDDVQELNERECLDALAALARHVPDRSQLVLAGRVQARLGVARARAGGELLELSVSELALSDDEAGTLIADAGLHVSAADAVRLNALAEGWAAVLYLASLNAPDGEAAVAALTGHGRFVSDYLRSEHLARLKPAEVRFLTRTSVLDRLSGPLCDAVLGRSGSARRLESLERTNQLVVPLDERRDWYRYHGLFRDLLRAELERREPQLPAQLCRAASVWCAANGEFDAAVDYAASSGDIDDVAELVGMLAFRFYRSGRVATVERWLALFDEHELERYPAVAVTGAWLHALRGRPEASERWMLAAERSAYHGPMPDGSASLRSWTAIVRGLLCREGSDAMLKDAEIALAELHPTSPWRPAALLVQGVGLLLGGRMEDADSAFARAAAAAASEGAAHVGVVASAERALIALDEGDEGRAAAQIDAGARFVRGDSQGDEVPMTILFAARARLAARRGEHEVARQALVRAQLLRPQLTYVLSWFAVQTRLELARVHVALRDVAGARTLLRETDEIMRRRPDLGLLRGEVERLGAEVQVRTEGPNGWASTLTAAELRLLPLLTTHLTFREIAERLFISRNTVKTQAISIYRKLDASSRSEAVARAVRLGLVDQALAARQLDFTPAG
jgi:LuxR family transcriptional regulator, maltose regulon positive regulatory protein